MFYSFNPTESVKKVIQNATEFALMHGSDQVGSEHLLYGIISISDSMASKLLKNYNVTKESYSKMYEDKVGDDFGFVSSDPTFTPRAKEIFRVAQTLSMQLNYDFVGTEHLLLAIVMSSDCMANTLLTRGFKVDLNELRNQLLGVLRGGTINFNEYEQKETSNNNIQNNLKSPLDEELLSMGSDLTLKAKQGKIDPVIGREKEINKIIEILCRKTKNNPVLIGEAGVGKSAIVEGLALAIAKGEVPSLLKDKVIYSLEIGGLMAGTKYRGSMEEKLKSAIEKIIANKNIIVFIDEIHTLAQAGSEQGEINPADMLKPYLSRGELQTIGATTTDEYRKYIEKDKALERRFQPVLVEAPNVEQTIEILKGLRDSYEAFHQVSIPDEAIVAAATLSDRFIMDRQLPDKAIDLIDQACSKVKVNNSIVSSDLKAKMQQIKELENNKNEALIQENFERAAKFRDAIKKLTDEVEKMQKDNENNYQKNQNQITAEDVAQIVSQWTNIPVTKLTESEKDRLNRLEDILHKRVIGQDEAVSAVARAIKRARAGLKDPKRPIGSFLFLGPTGVGKTELCKALAEAMFDDENLIIRLDMSEYMEQHSVAKLIGSPPGYVGHDEGGQLTEAVRRKPYSVVLFDEIEKAHPDVFNMLLQILDDGRLTDSKGRVVSFKNTIIIMTSNCGIGALNQKKRQISESGGEPMTDEQVKDFLMNQLKNHFKPEFLNRIDVITIFHSLTQKELAQIAKILMKKLCQKLKNQNIDLKLTERALKYLVEKGYDSEFGARPLRRVIEHEIEDKLAELLLSNDLKPTDNVVVDVENNELKLKIKSNEKSNN